MAAGVFSLVEGRGRKYLTGDERDCFIAVARADQRPAVQTFALPLVHTGSRISEALALRPVDIDLEATEIRFRTLKRRRDHWRAVPVPEAVVRELELVHGLRRAKRRPRGRNALLWPFSRPTATRYIAGLMAAAGIEGSQACPKGQRRAAMALPRAPARR